MKLRKQEVLVICFSRFYTMKRIENRKNILDLYITLLIDVSSFENENEFFYLFLLSVYIFS